MRESQKRLEEPGNEKVGGSHADVSSLFEQIVQIQKHRSEQSRVIHHWTGRFPLSEDWEVELGVAELIACSITDFFRNQNLLVHGLVGLEDDFPKFRCVTVIGESISAPREVMYFVEHRESAERFVLAVDTDRCGDVRISVYSSRASHWIALLREHSVNENHLRGHVFDLAGRVIPRGTVSLNDVILTEKQSTLVRRHVIGYARQVKELKDRGSRGQRGVLLEGVPGCGKSMLLKAIANELKGISVCIAGPDQICRHNSISVLKELIEMTAPCLVFIEEIDIFGADRRRGGGPGMAELMQIMDGLKNVRGVLWIGTTNRSEVVEKALADRPGRFDRRLEFGPLPDIERGLLVNKLIQPQVLTPEAHELATKLTRDMTGAQIRDLVETLRIMSNKDKFDTSDVNEAWKDCRFVTDQRFGFANR